MSNLYYTIQFTTPLSDVPARDLYRAYRRLARIINAAGREALHMCDRGWHIAHELTRPMLDLLSQLRIELMCRYGMDQVVARGVPFIELLEQDAMDYNVRVSNWKEAVFSDELNEHRRRLTGKYPMSYALMPILGGGLLVNLMGDRRAIDDLPF